MSVGMHNVCADMRIGMQCIDILPHAEVFLTLPTVAGTEFSCAVGFVAATEA